MAKCDKFDSITGSKHDVLFTQIGHKCYCHMIFVEHDLRNKSDEMQSHDKTGSTKSRIIAD